MAKGENIFKRRDGRWEARYIKGRELSGRIIYGFCYGRTYREAKEKVTRCKAALINGAPQPGAVSRHRDLGSVIAPPYCAAFHAATLARHICDMHAMQRK